MGGLFFVLVLPLALVCASGICKGLYWAFIAILCGFYALLDKVEEVFEDI